MELEILTYGHVRDAAGQKTLVREYPADTSVGDVLDALESAFDLTDLTADFEQNTLVVHKNGRDVKLDADLETTLEDGDRLSLTGTPMPE